MTLTDTMATAPTESSLHLHDWLLLLLIVAGGVVVYRFFAAKTADRRSKIDVSDYFLDATTRRMSWVQTTGAVGIGFLGIVLLYQCVKGANVDTIFGIFAASVVGPIITRIARGGEPVSPATYSDPRPKEPAPTPAPVTIGQVNQTGGTA